MAIVPKLVLDQIIIQFSYGGEHQKAKLGELEGAQFTEVEYLVDSKTGVVMGKTNNPISGQPRVLEPEKLTALLGGQFIAMEAQVREMQAGRAAVSKDLAEAGEQIAARDAQIASISASHADIAERLEATKQELTAANEAASAARAAAQELAARDTEIAAEVSGAAMPTGAAKRGNVRAKAGGTIGEPYSAMAARQVLPGQS